MAEPYYGNRQYRQYGNLGSGVNMMEGSSIPGGFESLTKSLAQIEQQKQLEEADRQQKFQELIKYDLKDVRGNWQDQAVAKKEDFINSATDIYRKSQGRPTWEQQKQLLAKKDGLEKFAGMSKEVEDWYGNAAKTVGGIKDIAAQKATKKNVNDIRNMGSLEEQYKAIQNNDWLVTPDYKLDKDVLDRLKDGKTTGGVVTLDDYKIQARGFLEANDDAYRETRDKWMADNIGKSEEDWIDHISKQKMYGVDRTIKKTGTGTGSGKRSESFVITPTNKGVWKTSGLNDGKGIPLSSVTDKESGEVYSGAAIDEIYIDDDGVKKIKISHNIPDKNKSAFVARKKSAMRAKIKKENPKASPSQLDRLTEDKYASWALINLIDIENIGKDQTARGITVHDYDDYAPEIERQGWTLAEYGGSKPTESAKGSDKKISGSDLM